MASAFLYLVQYCELLSSLVSVLSLPAIIATTYEETLLHPSQPTPRPTLPCWKEILPLRKAACEPICHYGTYPITKSGFSLAFLHPSKFLFELDVPASHLLPFVSLERNLTSRHILFYAVIQPTVVTTFLIYYLFLPFPCLPLVLLDSLLNLLPRRNISIL